MGNVRKLVRAGNGFDENVLSLDLEAHQRSDGAVKERLDDCVVPSGVDNGDLEVGAVVNGVGGANSLDSAVGHC